MGRAPALSMITLPACFPTCMAVNRRVIGWVHLNLVRMVERAQRTESTH